MKRLFVLLTLLATAVGFAVAASVAGAVQVGPPAGWPAYTGSLDGAAKGGCTSPLILSSADVSYPAPGSYSAYTFDLPVAYTFATLPLGSLINHQFTVVSGTQSQGEPYLIVRFEDATQAFVYSTEINGPGTGTYYSTLAGNVYETYPQALAEYGTKTVASVTLAVDNGGLEASFSDLASDACPSGAAPQVNHVFLCYSAFQTDPGVWPATIAASLMAQGYWSPYAVKGNVTGGTNVGGYHLACNLAAGQAAGQQFAGGDGFVPGVDAFKALAGSPGWYPLVP